MPKEAQLCKKSRYQRRREQKKNRRQKIRQSIAILRDEKIHEEQKKLEASPTYQQHVKNLAEQEAAAIEEENASLEQENRLWMEREKAAQSEWERKKKEDEEKKRTRELRENAIRTEWESIKQKEEQKRLERESKIAEEKRLQVKCSYQHYLFNAFYTKNSGIMVRAA